MNNPEQDQAQTRLHATISGRVQGVGFRAYTAGCARRLGLTGWVRNRINGKVETIAEGSRADLEDFLRSLRTGPGPAYVEQVEVDWLPASREFESFEVRWTI